MDLVYPGGAKYKINMHGTSRSPIGLWQFNSTMNDTSGSGFNLTVNAGTEYYASMDMVGTKGFYFNGSTTLIYTPPSHPSTLDITGAFTLEFLLLFMGAPATAGYFMTYGGNGSTQKDNILYQMGQTGTGAFSCNWEYGAPPTGPINIGTGAVPNNVCVGRVHHIAISRTGAVSKFYTDGVLLTTVDGVNAADTVAPQSQRLLVSAADSGTTGRLANTCIASLCLIGSQLTDAQVLADAQGCLPWLA